ncbi:helix-turn-helix domain-containing protein [Horticoccus sp. 23ND18S-11]|uniref:helix-turn-helix domain-containing protein n=1 Tax=Horticoccus sp. 23ND18S-11 TaxID=3391832 RepID=UPI0039C8D878
MGSRTVNGCAGYLQTGQVLFRAPSQRGFEAVKRLVGTEYPGLDQQELAAAYFKTRVVARKEYDSVIRLLTLFAEHLALISNQSVRDGTKAESPSITKGRTFIAEHQSEAMRLDDVAGAANMGKFYFCKLFKQATGFSFTEYLARARVEAVKRMLRNAQIRVCEAAFAAGFQSLSQFNRVFRRFAGEAPSTFRDRLHHSSENRPGLARAPRELALERR